MVLDENKRLVLASHTVLDKCHVWRICGLRQWTTVNAVTVCLVLNSLFKALSAAVGAREAEQLREVSFVYIPRSFHVRNFVFVQQVPYVPR